MSKFVSATVGIVALIGATMLGAVPAAAASTSPANIYYPNGGCSSGATGQNFVDSGGTQISADLFGNDGDQVTIHNQCSSATIYIYYGQAQPFTALNAGANATFTLTNNVVQVQAYDQASGETFGQR